MKKHLIAAAVAAAVAVPAVAQVTISGTFDTFAGKVDTGTAGANQSLFTSGTDGTATSQLVFTATEDLGSGMKATMRLQNYFGTNNGVDTSLTANTAGTTPAVLSATTSRTFDQAFVAISGGFGEVKLGRTASNASEAWGLGKFGGNLGRIASAQAAIGRESDNTMVYTSPTINGVTAELWRSNEHTAGTGDNDATALSLRYAQGSIGAAVGQVKANTSSTVESKLTSGAVQFDAGVAKLGVFYVSYDPSNAVATDKVETTQFHAEIPVGNGVRILGTYGMIETKGTANADNTHVVIGVEKALSKRTAIYAAHLSNDNDSGVKFAIRGTTAGTSNGDDAKSTIIGVRHTF